MSWLKISHLVECVSHRMVVHRPQGFQLCLAGHCPQPLPRITRLPHLCQTLATYFLLAMFSESRQGAGATLYAPCVPGRMATLSLYNSWLQVFHPVTIGRCLVLEKICRFWQCHQAPPAYKPPVFVVLATKAIDVSAVLVFCLAATLH